MPEPAVAPVTPVSNPDPSYIPASAPAAQPAGDALWFKDTPYADFVTGNETHFEKYKSADEFVKGGLEAMKMIGKKGQYNTEIPQADDPAFAAKMNDVYKKLGRPDTVDGYKVDMLEVPPEFADRISFSEDFQKEAAKLAHEGGVSQDVFNKMAALQQTMTINAEKAKHEASLAKAAECEKELSKDPEFAVKGELVKRLLTSEKAQGLADELAENGYGNSPVLFQILAAHAKEQFGEGTVESAKNVVPGSTAGPAKPKELSQYELDKLRHPYSPELWRKGPND